MGPKVIFSIICFQYGTNDDINVIIWAIIDFG